MKKWISVLLILALLATLAATAFAAPEDEALAWSSVCVIADESAADARAQMQTIAGKNYLFLPSGVSAEAVPFTFTLTQAAPLLSVRGAKKAVGVRSGEALNLIELCGSGKEYDLTLTAKKGAEIATLALTVIPTDGIASMFLMSDDPVNHGRPWVESSPDKSNKATGSMLMTDEAGEIVYNGKLTQIKGRGNSTWLADKKPYQIKLKDKTDLLQTGDNDNRAKTWVLLTNASDDSLLRNQIVYSLSVAMQMQPGIECRPVNLYYDGEYRGAYLLCEKVEIGSGRVDIRDLEEENENVNPADTDFEKLERKTGKTANGATYIYCEGMVSPEDVKGGYLLEMDTAVRATAEACYFVTTRDQYVVVKSPEFCSKAEMEYIASLYQEFEDTVYHKGVNPDNGKTLADYASVESIAQCYIINELTKNPDGYRTSSYLYKGADSDIMTMGPIWDYDLSFGSSWGEFVESCANPKEFFTLCCTFGETLYQIPAFREEVRKIYTETVSPLVTDTLLKDDAATEDGALLSLNIYRAQLAAAARANAVIWHNGVDNSAANLAAVRDYIAIRNNWLSEAFSTWSAETFTPLSGFSDVVEGAWYYDAVNAAAEYGLVNGLGNRIFAPNNRTTRAQATKVLFEMSGESGEAYSKIFSDVTEGTWYVPAVMWAAKNGIVNGYEDGTFHPDAKITRQDLLVILHRYLKSPAASVKVLDDFTDGASVPAYARDAVAWALENGVLEGYEDKTIRPYNDLSRAELAAIAVRFYEKYVLKPET